MDKLKVGRINYANLFPIYYTLEKEFDCSSYEFVDGVPSKLNGMLREGAIDVSPSSSVEYLNNRSLYNIMDGLSVSSRGPVGSVFLFTRKLLENLSGNLIILTTHSATSTALLKVILKKFYGLDCEFELSDSPEREGKNNFLMIGDDAIRHHFQMSQLYSDITECDAADAEPVQCLGPQVHMYDLGKIWFEKTGLPFVFALWTARKELYDTKDPRHEIFMKFTADLNAAKKIALGKLPEIAEKSPLRPIIDEEGVIKYWENLDYDLTEDHKKGLKLFEEYMGSAQ
jgi:chorismate dehydratase